MDVSKLILTIDSSLDLEAKYGNYLKLDDESKKLC